MFVWAGANSVSPCHYVIPFNDLYAFSKSTYVDHQVDLIKLLIFPLLSSDLNFNGANKLVGKRNPQLQIFCCATKSYTNSVTSSQGLVWISTISYFNLLTYLWDITFIREA